MQKQSLKKVISWTNLRSSSPVKSSSLERSSCSGAALIELWGLKAMMYLLACLSIHAPLLCCSGMFLSELSQERIALDHCSGRVAKTVNFTVWQPLRWGSGKWNTFLDHCSRVKRMAARADFPDRGQLRFLLFYSF